MKDNEELLGPKVSYLSAIGALMHLENYTKPYIAFSINLLTRYISSPIKRHWNRIMDIPSYLRGTIDIGYLFTYEGFAIS